jgi:hypothetical protein
MSAAQDAAPGKLANGQEYPIPDRIVVFVPGGDPSEAECPLTFRVNDKGTHVYRYNGRILGKSGFQVSITVSKVKSGDPVKLREAQKARLRAQLAAIEKEEAGE